jgi:hypothetical protein
MSIVDTAKGAIQAAMQTAVTKLVPFAPDSWIPGGVPDPLIGHQHGLIGTPVSRLDGPLKVRGAARFAAEVPLDNLVYAALVYGTIPSGRIATLDTQTAEAAPGVVLVMTYRNAPRLNSPAPFGSSPTAAAASDLPIMQDDLLGRGKGGRAEAWPIHGPGAIERDRRCRTDARGGAVQSRSCLSHATSQSQRDRAARCDDQLEGRRTHYS